MNVGDTVVLQGTVLSVRSGFVRVRWDNGSVTYEWPTDIGAATDSPQPAAAEPP